MEKAKFYVPLPQIFTVSVVGVSFVPGYPDNIYLLEQMWMEANMAEEPLAAILIRNPDNAYDTNAVEIHVPSLGEAGFIGHVPAGLAARMAPELDRGVLWRGAVSYVKINPDHPERPGLDVEVERIGEQHE